MDCSTGTVIRQRALLASTPPDGIDGLPPHPGGQVVPPPPGNSRAMTHGAPARPCWHRAANSISPRWSASRTSPSPCADRREPRGKDRGPRRWLDPNGLVRGGRGGRYNRRRRADRVETALERQYAGLVERAKERQPANGLAEVLAEIAEGDAEGSPAQVRAGLALGWRDVDLEAQAARTAGGVRRRQPAGRHRRRWTTGREVQLGRLLRPLEACARDDLDAIVPRGRTRSVLVSSASDDRPRELLRIAAGMVEASPVLPGAWPRSARARSRSGSPAGATTELRSLANNPATARGRVAPCASATSTRMSTRPERVEQ